MVHKSQGVLESEMCHLMDLTRSINEEGEYSDKNRSLLFTLENKRSRSWSNLPSTTIIEEKENEDDVINAPNPQEEHEDDEKLETRSNQSI